MWLRCHNVAPNVIKVDDLFSMPIEIANKIDHPCDERSIASLMEFAFDSLGLDQECDLAISIVGLEEMSELHLQWMQEPGPTDVLSFPMDEISLGEAGPGILGDIVLCPEFAREGAQKAGSTLDEELQLLSIHGLLHLLGLDHREEEEAKAMFALQGEILGEWRSRS